MSNTNSATAGNRPTVGYSPCKAIAVTLLCTILVLAGVLATLIGTRYVLKNNSVWVVSGYTGLSDSLKIPDSRFGLPVTKVSDQAFLYDDSLKRIELGSNITELGRYAFYSCTNLESVKLNYGLTTIGNLCFCECTSLEELVIPSTVTSISGSAFNGCDNLTIIAPSGSYAAEYAVLNDINWKSTFEVISDLSN